MNSPISVVSINTNRGRSLNCTSFVNSPLTVVSNTTPRGRCVCVWDDGTLLCSIFPLFHSFFVLSLASIFVLLCSFLNLCFILQNFIELFDVFHPQLDGIQQTRDENSGEGDDEDADDIFSQAATIYEVSGHSCFRIFRFLFFRDLCPLRPVDLLVNQQER